MSLDHLLVVEDSLDIGARDFPLLDHVCQLLRFCDAIPVGSRDPSSALDASSLGHSAPTSNGLVWINKVLLLSGALHWKNLL